MLGNTQNKVLRPDYEIPKSLSDFNPNDFFTNIEKFVRKNVNKGKIAVSISGGVDSSVTAFSLREIVGDELVYPFFIDDGLRRKIKGRDEWEVTADVFRDFKNFRVIDVKDRVLPLLYGLSNGEVKRNIFRKLYTDISNEYIKEIGASYIADGTILPDIIETLGSIKVKTQHNVNLPYDVEKLEILAPLYKPHVRRLGKVLGLPDDVVFGIPCPGPAQLIRVVGEFTPNKLEVSKIATDIIEQMVDQYCEKIWGRKFLYDETTGVRSPFQMFAGVLDDWFKELDGIRCYKMKNRATYIEEGVRESSEPFYMPIIWLKPDDKLDFNAVLDMERILWNRFGYPRVLYQVCDSGRSDGYPVAIRVVMSDDATTAQPMNIDFDYLSTIGEEIIRSSRSVTKVAYDFGVKPPATIEFE